MLKKITLNNFKSFKNETVIDLKATGYKTLGSTNVHEATLKGSLFVGSNASGKTNIIQSLRLLLDLLFAEKKVDIYTYKCLFSEAPAMSLEYEFEISKSAIKYWIEYDVLQNRFSEKLFVDSDLLINRIGAEAESKVTENKNFSDIDSNSLLLREIYFNTKFRSHALLREWFDFLLNSVYLNGHEMNLFSPGKYNLDLVEYLEKNGAAKVNEFFKKYNFHQVVEFAKESKGNFLNVRTDEDMIFFKREGVGEPIPFQLESLGNQKILALLPIFFHVTENGGMLIVDEFSSGLHNFLEELLVKEFMNKSANSQLFLVSHSTNLLSNSLLRPDQIYAVNFNGMNGSQVKVFSSEQPRVAQNLEKMYTSGIFGGVPNYNDEN